MNNLRKNHIKKRFAALFISFCNVICLFPDSNMQVTKAADGYGVIVNGINVTSENASDILGKGNKEIVFEQPDKLIINKDITLSSPIIGNIGLSVVVPYDITINCTGLHSCFELNKNSFIKGKGSLTVKSDNDFNLIKAYSGLVVEDIKINSAQIDNSIQSRISLYGNSPTAFYYVDLNSSNTLINSYSSDSYVSDSDIRITASKFSLGNGSIRTSRDLMLQGSIIDCKEIHGNTDKNKEHTSVFSATDSEVRTSGRISDFYGGYEFSDCAVNSPVWYKVDSKTGGITDYDGKVPDKVIIGEDETGKYDVYDLYIRGEMATSRNSSDILGDGVFSYDNKSKTLTVKGECHLGNKNIVSRIDGLTVNIAENSTFRAQDEYGCLYFYEPTTITGKGKLRIIKGTGDEIYSDKDLTITDADIEILRNVEYGRFGIFTMGRASALNIQNSKLKTDASIWGFHSMNITNSDIDLGSGCIFPFELPGKGDPLNKYKREGLYYININDSNIKCGSIMYFKSGVNLNGCEIVEPKGAKYSLDNGSISDADGEIARNVVIAATTTTTTQKPTTTTTTMTTQKPTTTTTTTTTQKPTTTTTQKPTTTTTTMTTQKPTTTTSTTTTQKPATTVTTTKLNIPDNYVLGDVNNDKIVDAKDASTVLTYYSLISVNKKGNFNESQLKAADVNDDGIVSAVDASGIISYYAYISTTKEKIMSLKDFMIKLKG